MKYAMVLLVLTLCAASGAQAQSLSSSAPPQPWSVPSPTLATVPTPPLLVPRAPAPPGSLAPVAPTPADRASLGRYVGWGAVAGASAGVISSLFVLSACGGHCDHSRAAGVAMHVGVGTLSGAAAGAILHLIRR